MIKAVVFDMDGVLIEAKNWHYEALNKSLRLFGHEISKVDHLTTYDGLPTWKKLEMLSIERGLPVELHEFINEMKQLYTMEIVHTQCKPRFVHEYALLKLDDKNRLELVPSGTPVIKRGQSKLRLDANFPNISREQLGKIWQNKIAAKREIKRIPAKKSP